MPSLNQSSTVALGLTCIYVETEEQVKTMLSEIAPQLAQTPILNVDFEGIDLCKSGQVCLGQFHVSMQKLVYVVDFCSMNPFTVEASGYSLKSILESKKILKVWFDPRNDIDAIANQFNVHPTDALCLQIAEVATRKQQGLQTRLVCGLKKTLETYLVLPPASKRAVLGIKEAGLALFAPERGGTYEVFRTRPIRGEILLYSAVDVFYFDQLRQRLYSPLTQSLKANVDSYSERRMVEHQKPGYVAKGRHMAISPF